MKMLALALVLTATTANAADSVWVQATSTGYEARLVTSAASCPTLRTDKGDAAMTLRAAATDTFPLVCAAALPANAKSAVIRGASKVPCQPASPGCAPGLTRMSAWSQTLPVPVTNPQRILVLGDTGCRIKGAALQACNDPEKWPFPALAKAAAGLKPDLVIHVGDYLYRESQCPAGNAGCAGSPWGDNWTTWNADFYDPAAPLLAAAPIVLVRGNHEDCKRAGPGWFRLQGPGAFDAAAPCLTHVPQFLVDLGALKLAVLDDNNSDEATLDTGQAQIYAAELDSLMREPGPVWLVHHRPAWAAITGPLGIPIGGNLSLIEASRMLSAKGEPPVPHPVSLMLSGHIHTFESINYDQDVPPQIVAGNGGDRLDPTPANLRGTQFVGHGGVTVADGLSVGGFGFLLMTRMADGWTIDLYDPAAKPKGQCHFREPVGSARGRLDCPALKG
jgi:Calcineurin-like phosphoesterase